MQSTPNIVWSVIPCDRTLVTTPRAIATGASAARETETMRAAVGPSVPKPTSAAAEELDAHHTPPLAVEAPVPAVHAYLPPAARAHQREARMVRAEDLADQLVVATPLSLRGERVQEHGADSGPARVAIHVERGLA